MTYYIFGGSVFDASACKVYLYADLGGYAESLFSEYPRTKTDADMQDSDPYWRLGGSSGGQTEVEIGLNDDYRIKIDETGVYAWDETGATWVNLLSGVAAHNHDGDTLQLDGINSNGGAFSFTTTGDITFNAKQLKSVANPTLDQDVSTKKFTDDHNWLEADITDLDKYTQAQVDALLHTEAHTLASHTTKAHQELTDYNAEANVKHLTDAQVAALHATYTNAEAVAAVAAADDYLKNDANDETTGDLTVANLITAGLVDSVDISDLKDAFDALDYYTQAQVDGLIPAAGDFNHNDLANLNAGDVYEHISAAQLAALHAIVVAGDLNHNDLANIDAGDINHLTDVQVAALHAAITVNAPIVLTDQDIELKNDNAVQITEFDTSPLTASDTKVPTNTTVKEYVDLLKEQSAAFPVAPNEGDLHYDEDLDSLYRYNGEAEAWVEVGVGGLVVESIDNLGNHVATQDLNMDSNKILNVVDPTTDQGAATKKFVLDNSINNVIEDGSPDLVSSTSITIKPSGNTSQYLVLMTHLGIPYIYAFGTDTIYFRSGTAGNWETLHANDFVNETPPMPKELCTESILNVKNNIDGTLDKKSLPKDVYYIDKNGENEGMKLGAMVLHLTKTVQELESRIKELEEK